jgi:hypothetical protein
MKGKEKERQEKKSKPDSPKRTIFISISIIGGSVEGI